MHHLFDVGGVKGLPEGSSSELYAVRAEGLDVDVGGEPPGLN